MKTGKKSSCRVGAAVVLAILATAANGVYAQDASKPVASASATTSTGCGSPVGTWVNQMGSKLKIISIDNSTGAIKGEYQTASGAGGWYPLTGWVNTAPPVQNKDNAKIISFSVRWGSIGSITSWTGFCRGTNELRTLWNLGRSNSDYEWDHVLAGADQFKPL
jgi:hypothetical protein